jgi:hypothetical protein
MYHYRNSAQSFVEYVVEVKLTEPEGLHRIRGPQSKVSTYPITFVPTRPTEPIHDWHLQAEQRLCTISTLKLMPEHAGTSLGFRDSMRSIFQRSSLPHFSFGIEVQTPGVIQLLHPESIPFLVRVTPDLDPERTTIDPASELAQLVLRAATMEIKVKQRCRARHTSEHCNSYEITLMDKRDMNLPLRLTTDKSPVSETTLDLAHIHPMRLGNMTLGKEVEQPLCPSFKSYNVSRMYYLSWELEISCAGKTEKFKSAKHGPEVQVILPAGSSPNYQDSGNGMYLGSELAQAHTAISTYSEGSRLSHASSSRRSREDNVNGKHEYIDVTSDEAVRGMSKEHEATAEVSRQGGNEVQPAYSEHPPLNEFSNLSTGAMGHQEAGNGSQLPRYEP